MTPLALSTRLFLQLAVVVLTCRGVCLLAAKFGQPPVVGEMIAGIALGPSLLGWLAPAAHRYLFPDDSRPILFAGAQIGLVLYMFTVGLEFDPRILATRLRTAATISAAGILAPALLGFALAVPLFRHGGFFSAGISQSQAGLFLAAALAITAFPMLARIIVERGLAGTRVGSLALAAGALDDAGSWAVLAIVVASVRRDAWVAVTAIAGAAVFVAVIFVAARRPLLALERLAGRGPRGDKAALAWTLAALAVCAWFTDMIGLYAVFGAVFFGAAVPRGAWSDRLRSAIEPIAVALFLPLFFVYSGLNTHFSFAAGAGFWVAGGAILVVAVLGKTGACYAAARLCGEDQTAAWGVGTLMNARGLMELIALNIGLEHGIVTPALFALLTLMAVVTTLMATPMFNRLSYSPALDPRIAGAPEQA